MLNGLIYMSTKNVQLTKIEYDQLVKQAALKNDSLDVTGFICELEDNYLQYLEGDGESVDKVMSSIRDDSRHHKIVEFNYEIDDRYCSSWSMMNIPTSMVGSVHFGHLIANVLGLLNKPGFNENDIKKMIQNLVQKWLTANGKRSESH